MFCIFKANVTARYRKEAVSQVGIVTVALEIRQFRVNE
jgi:hypothetical protein